nr:5-(carboxyamino)imidazole ribonucleotide mutase [Oceanococcus sp. HetDA_MAG_MS8]
MTDSSPSPIVGLVMGSRSDWPVMEHAADILRKFDLPFEARVVSAHRTPQKLHQYGESARDRGLKVIIAGAGGAAHLPGMLAAVTPLPVFGVPVAHEKSMLRGIDALLSIVQMPKGVPVPTFAIGKAGAANAALSAVAVLALENADLAKRLDAFRSRQTAAIEANDILP